jgi:hypothetical protein
LSPPTGFAIKEQRRRRYESRQARLSRPHPHHHRRRPTYNCETLFFIARIIITDVAAIRRASIE